LLLLVITLPFLLIRLSEVPATWFDEGINLTAARTLAETGVYGLRSAEGLRPADPAIQSGPPLIVLLAALHPVIGPNIMAARLLVVLFGLLTLVVLYLLAYRMYGLPSAYLSIWILLILPGENTGSFIMQSRQFLGEIPAAMFLLLAMLLLLNDELSLKHNILIGLCLGIASALKSQVLVLVLVTLVVRALYAAGQERETLKRWVVILAVMFAVYGLDMGWRALMAGPMLDDNSAVLREGIAIHIFPFRALTNLRDRQVLFRLALVILAVGGTLALYRTYPAFIPKQHGQRRVERFLMVLISVWIVWYALASIGWIRYAFICLVLCTLLLGRLGGWFWQQTPWLNSRLRYLLLTFFGAALMFIGEGSLLANSQGRDFYQVMDYVERNIPADAPILTWEWPAVYQTNHQYLLPETRVTNAITAPSFMRDRYEYDPAIFDPLPHCPRYLLYGSFSVDRIVLGEAVKEINLVPIYSVGPYELYEIPLESLREQAPEC